jgi:hypothetical protein
MALSTNGRSSNVASTLFHGDRRLKLLFAALKKPMSAMNLWKHVCWIERLMLQVVAGLCQLREAVAINGLAVWTRRQTPKGLLEQLGTRRWMHWLSAAVWDARGNWERAALE